MTTLASTPEEFLQLLRSRHAMIMGGRPDKRPGLFKEAANRAGNSLFVLPELVPGTLRAGWDGLAALDTAFERAVYMMFLVSEVHPFDDGNGRVARVMMNTELVSGAQSRIIIPTVFRDDYLGGLRQMTRRSDPSVLIKSLRYGHDLRAGARCRRTSRPGPGQFPPLTPSGPAVTRPGRGKRCGCPRHAAAASEDGEIKRLTPPLRLDRLARPFLLAPPLRLGRLGRLAPPLRLFRLAQPFRPFRLLPLLRSVRLARPLLLAQIAGGFRRR